MCSCAKREMRQRASLVRQHVAVHVGLVQASAAAIRAGAYVAAIAVKASALGSVAAVLEEVRLNVVVQELLLSCTGLV